MGVCNLSPDSFSGDGLGADLEATVGQAKRMVAEGADIIDIGGESTRPGTEPLSLDDIDVEAFTNGVVRMINNIDSLLEVRSTIVRRAASFLSKDYDDQVLKATMESFKEMHGIVPGKTRREVEGEDFQAPRAGEAGPAGGM